jgi:outer membrane receptor protein involved in Fe transport
MSFSLKPLIFALSSVFVSLSWGASDPLTPTTSDCCDTPINNVVIKSKRIDSARNGLSQDTGSSSYNLNKDDVETLPMGTSTPLNEVVLQAPGAAQDAQGQVHIRGDHGNMQYRINGVALPDAVSGFAPALDAHFANNINLITGALPAQYGLRTAAVIDIHTADLASEPNQSHVGTLIGTNQHREINADTAGQSGDWSYLATGARFDNDLGLNNVTGASTALHDQTQQGRYFGFASYKIDARNHLDVMTGDSLVNLQIPNVPGKTPTYSLTGVTAPASANLNANQQEHNQFEVVSLTHESSSTLSYQGSLFHRLSNTQYAPDALGDLIYNGVAANILRQNEAYGGQFDATQKVNAQHTVRWGLNFQHENMVVNNTSNVFNSATQTSFTTNQIESITDNHQFGGNTLGLYVQDEYKLTSQLVVNYGLRYDNVNTITQEHQFSPRIGLVYDSTETTRWHLGYARYFTPPPTEKIDSTSINLFQNTSNATPSTGNSPVLAERSSYVDAGVLHLMTHNWSVGMNGYYKQAQNLQDEGQFGNALVYSAFNYAEGRIWGLEWTTDYHAQDWHTWANLARSAAYGKQIESGQFNFSAAELNYINNNWVHLDHDQMWTASGGVSYTQAQRTYSLNVVAGTGMRSGEDNLDHLPAYATMNTALVQKFQDDTWGENSVRVSVINLFDRVYELRDGSGIGVGAPQWGQRRTLYVGLTHTFE